MRILAGVTSLLVASLSVGSAQLSGQSRAQQIAAAFTKYKHVDKESHGIRREKYKDVRSEPTVRQSVGDYSGEYEVADLDYGLTVEVARDGTIRASGVERGRRTRTFNLENAKIEGAVLTAAKVYHDGTVERFEGVFLTRTDRDSPTDPGVVTYGLGVVLATPLEVGGITYDKLFYQLKQ
jgi:hypothetical protein